MGRCRSLGRVSLRSLWLAVPLALTIVFLVLIGRTQGAGGAAVPARAPTRGHDGRLVIVIVDSLRRATLEQPGLMPSLLALAREPHSTTVDVHTCASNFSLPCIQTIFSGRESPMSSGIEEFAGYQASHRHVMDAAAAAGLNVALVGNDMLSTLYGRRARARFSVAPLHLEALPSDLAAISQAEAYLRDPTNDMVVLHASGTDHVTHYELPGTTGYARHFRAVDAALAGLVAQLDLARDSLVVMGDHGHDNDGHHTRHSVAIFAGHRYEELCRQIDLPADGLEQKDLLYLLSYPHQLPMSPDYEGRFFAIRAGHPAGQRLEAFLDLQRRNLTTEWRAIHQAGQDAHESGESGPAAAVNARMNPAWRAGNDKALTALSGALPLMSCLFLWVAWTYGDGAGLSARPVVGAGGLAVATWFAQRGSWASPLVLAAVPVAIAGWLAFRRRSRRTTLMLVLLVAAAATTASIEPAWRSFFHSRDEFHWGIPLFYAVMLGAGALLAAVRGAGAASWPWATHLAAFVALPAGVYYYQFNENVLRGYLVPAGLLIAWRTLRAGGWVVALPWSAQLRASRTPGVAARLPAAWRRWWRLAVPLAVGGLLLMPQDAGGWQWHSWLAGKLAAMPRAVPVALFGATLVWLVALLDSWRSRAGMAILLLGLSAYVTAAAGLEPHRLVAALMVVLFVGAWIAAQAPGTAGRSPKGRFAPCQDSDETSGLMLAAGAVAIVLTTCDGLAVEHVDFAFALRYTTTFRTDAARFLLVAPLVALKYGGPLLALLAFHRLLRGPAATDRTIGAMLLFLTLKMLALLIQVLVGALDTGEKFFELAQTDFLFVACLVIVTAMWTVVLWAADLIAHAFGLTRSAATRTALPDEGAVGAQ